MSTHPRNPAHFPRMKVRGARRRQIAPLQRMVGAAAPSFAAAVDALAKLGQAGMISGAAFLSFGAAFARGGVVTGPSVTGRLITGEYVHRGADL